MIACDAAKVRKRRNEIVPVLRPIASKSIFPVTLGTFPRAIYVTAASPGVHPHDARIQSWAPRVLVNYYEVWQEGERDEYVLERIYLHIYERVPQTFDEREVLALHCDPLTDRAENSYRYKRGPHLHISSSNYGFARSHTALCLQALDETCGDVAKLTEAISLATQMIADEFLPRLS